ncbi:MAG: hypothetical protein NTZ78_06045 [Candidatus Aureabacteria bacterium]|nr:hypothetical protein [Candidatus Auribacterota bacterium]
MSAATCSASRAFLRYVSDWVLSAVRKQMLNGTSDVATTNCWFGGRAEKFPSVRPTLFLCAVTIASRPARVPGPDSIHFAHNTVVNGHRVLACFTSLPHDPHTAGRLV